MTDDEKTSLTPAYPAIGSFVGLYDSAGEPIRVGDVMKCEVTANIAFHGEWAYYEVCVRGMVPVLLYLRSEKVVKLPKHSQGMVLSDKYEAKSLLWSKLETVTPYDEMYVCSDSYNGEDKENNGCRD